VVEEPIFAEATLRWFYEHPLGRVVFATLVNRKAVCDLYGRRMDHPRSRARIAPFVEGFAIDMTEAERPVADYRSFNDFFHRTLKPGARTWPADPASLGSPGDGKLLVYPKLDLDVRLPIKGTACSPAALLASEAEAATYAGGSAFVLRLAPPDYHRFHFPDGGVAGPAREIPGGYDSVNPIALARVPDLFCRNKRAVTTIETDRFGRMAYLEVGAITIGAIVQTYAPGRVERGQEKGYFRYGGSTIVALFPPGAVEFDPDLVADAAVGLEVRVRAGEAIGRAPG
jgi:phosphatidylserine decarboxylase